VEALQSQGRDVQALRSSLDGTGTSPTEALRTALRLGSGALVVGEIRGEEAGTLYEAMRVGANDGAVLGTIHGDGGAAVRERVVADLGVPESSFAATDLLVTLEAADSADGTQRRVRAIEEVERTGGGGTDAGGEGDPDGDAASVEFVSLYERDGDGLGSTDRIERGNSRLVAALTRPEESYAGLRGELSARTEWLDGLAETGRTDPETVERARVDRERVDRERP
jgi:flagellar protein FlaI